MSKIIHTSLGKSSKDDHRVSGLWIWNAGARDVMREASDDELEWDSYLTTHDRLDDRSDDLSITSRAEDYEFEDMPENDFSDRKSSSLLADDRSIDTLSYDDDMVATFDDGAVADQVAEAVSQALAQAHRRFNEEEKNKFAINIANELHSACSADDDDSLSDSVEEYTLPDEDDLEAERPSYRKDRYPLRKVKKKEEKEEDLSDTEPPTDSDYRHSPVQTLRKQVHNEQMKRPLQPPPPQQEGGGGSFEDETVTSISFADLTVEGEGISRPSSNYSSSYMEVTLDDGSSLLHQEQQDPETVLALLRKVKDDILNRIHSGSDHGTISLDGDEDLASSLDGVLTNGGTSATSSVFSLSLRPPERTISGLTTQSQAFSIASRIDPATNTLEWVKVLPKPRMYESSVERARIRRAALRRQALERGTLTSVKETSQRTENSKAEKSRQELPPRAPKKYGPVFKHVHPFLDSEIDEEFSLVIPKPRMSDRRRKWNSDSQITTIRKENDWTMVKAKGRMSDRNRRKWSSESNINDKASSLSSEKQSSEQHIPALEESSCSSNPGSDYSNRSRSSIRKRLENRSKLDELNARMESLIGVQMSPERKTKRRSSSSPVDLSEKQSEVKSSRMKLTNAFKQLSLFGSFRKRKQSTTS